MKKQINNNLTSFTDHLDEQYGKRGTKEREEFEEGFETFKLGLMLQELRKEQGMTQEQLAQKCDYKDVYFQN
jgi:HTH-type transcriptional regulator / antitoxin HipB